MADGFTEDWYQQHQARMAGLKAHAVAAPAPSATRLGPVSAGQPPAAGERVEKSPAESRAKALDEANVVVGNGEACPNASAAGGHGPQLGAGAAAAERVSRGSSGPVAAESERRLGLRKARPGALAGDVTGGERPAPKSKQRPEEVLQIAVAELLDLGLPQGWRWWHTPNQRGTRKFWEQQLLKALGVKAGIQDVTIVGPDPRLVIIELKSGTGSLSKAQREWRDYYRSIGVPWFLARSIEDVIAACQDAGVPLRVRV